MGNCAKLKWNRKKLGMTQKEFAKAAGLDVGTINKLENDETAWLTVKSTTEDKIYAMFEGQNVWDMKPEEKGSDTHTETIEQDVKIPIGMVTQEMVEQATRQYEQEKKIHNSLSAHDKKTLTLIEFAYEGLMEAKTHADFEANINIIKRVINKY